MKNYVDLKITIWKRLHFEDSANMNEVVDLLKTTGTVYELSDETLGFRESEILFETELPIAPKDNHGDATIEVYSNNETIWSNDQ